MKDKQVKPCPTCGKIAGWWENHIHMYQQYFDADGTPCHASDGSGTVRKRKFCYDCNTNISKCIEDGYLPEPATTEGEG